MQADQGWGFIALSLGVVIERQVQVFGKRFLYFIFFTPLGCNLQIRRIFAYLSNSIISLRGLGSLLGLFASEEISSCLFCLSITQEDNNRLNERKLKLLWWSTWATTTMTLYNVFALFSWKKLAASYVEILIKFSDYISLVSVENQANSDRDLSLFLC